MSPALTRPQPTRPPGAKHSGGRGFSLRAVRSGDRELLLGLREAMLAEVGEFPPMSRRRHARRFRAWFAEELRARRLTGYIATDERGRPWGAGLVWLQPRQPGLSSARKFTPYIFSMYTEPEFRRRGVASAVVRALVDWARRRGYTRVDLQATPAGRPVYERLGFRPTSHMRLELPGPHRGR